MGFEPGETLRMIRFLKPGARIITAVRPVIPVTAALAGGTYDGRKQLEYLRTCPYSLLEVDTDGALQSLGNPKVGNVVLLGAAAATGNLGVSVEDIRNAIRVRIPEKLQEINFRALDFGAKLV